VRIGLPRTARLGELRMFLRPEGDVMVLVMRCPKGRVAIEIIERVFAPKEKGLHDSARGFNPGNRPNRITP
jgi:hypothetical protein